MTKNVILNWKNLKESGIKQNVLEIGSSYRLLSWCEAYTSHNVLESSMIAEGLSKGAIILVVDIKKTFFYDLAEIFFQGKRLYIICNQPVKADQIVTNIWAKVC